MKEFKGLFILLGTFITAQTISAQGFSRFLGKSITICGPKRQHCMHGLGGKSEGRLLKYHGNHDYNKKHANGRFVIRRTQNGGFTICAEDRKLCIGDGTRGNDNLSPIRYRRGKPEVYNIRSTGRRDFFTICARNGRHCIHGWGGYGEGKPLRAHGGEKYNKVNSNGSFRFSIVKKQGNGKMRRSNQRRSNQRRSNQRRSNQRRSNQRRSNQNYDKRANNNEEKSWNQGNNNFNNRNSSRKISRNNNQNQQQRTRQQSTHYDY